MEFMKKVLALLVIITIAGCDEKTVINNNELSDADKYYLYTGWLSEHYPDVVPELVLSESEVATYYKSWLAENDTAGKVYFGDDNEAKFNYFLDWLVDYDSVKLAQELHEPERWPTITYRSEFQTLVEDRVHEFISNNYDPGTYMVEPYQPLGDYLQYSRNLRCRELDGVRKFDDNHILMVNYQGSWQYNPVSMSQCAMDFYGRYLKSGSLDELNVAIAHADKLVEMQQPNGAYPYNFRWKYYLTKETYSEGWTSAMAQGQVMSLLARIYHETRDRKYLASGNLSLEYLKLSVADGGVQTDLSYLDPSLKKYIFFAEYIAVPYSYTLNGYMFTQLGLYDWWYMTSMLSGPETFSEYELSMMELSKSYFDRSMESLEKILPYFDIGGMSAYDLGYITHGPERLPHTSARYHRVHIYQLNALYSITGSQKLLATEMAWSKYVQFDNKYLGRLNHDVVNHMK